MEIPVDEEYQGYDARAEDLQVLRSHLTDVVDICSPFKADINFDALLQTTDNVVEGDVFDLSFTITLTNKQSIKIEIMDITNNKKNPGEFIRNIINTISQECTEAGWFYGENHYVWSEVI